MNAMMILVTGHEALEMRINEYGFMMRRFASINDLPIKESDRTFFWALGKRPDDHPGLSHFGF